MRILTMNKFIKIIALTMVTTAYAASSQANSIGELQLAGIAKKTGDLTPQQQSLLIRHGH